MQSLFVLYPQHWASTIEEIMSACQLLCSDRLKHSCCCLLLLPPHRPRPALSVVLAERSQDWHSSWDCCTVCIFHRVSRILHFHTIAKNKNKKSPADSRSDEGAGSSRRLFILKGRPPLVCETSSPETPHVLLSHGKTVYRRCVWTRGAFRQRTQPLQEHVERRASISIWTNLPVT